MIEEQKGTAEAESILEELGFDSLPIVPSEVVESINSDDFRVVMESKPFDSDQILGKAEGDNEAALIYLNSNIPDTGRFNFTAAHEIGHVCMHIMPQKKMFFECGTKELTNPFDDPIEKEANGFASGLLLPEYLISKLTDGEIHWKNIEKISNSCKSSLEATYRRMSVLDKSPSALIIHKNGVFQRFVPSNNFGFYIERSPLSSEQEDLCVDIKDDKYPADFDTVDAADWINPSNKGTTLESIYSNSIILSEGFTYTILTYDDDCLSENTVQSTEPSF